MQKRDSSVFYPTLDVSGEMEKRNELALRETANLLHANLFILISYNTYIFIEA